MLVYQRVILVASPHVPQSVVVSCRGWQLWNIHQWEYSQRVPGHAGWCPPVISWSIIPFHYSYIIYIYIYIYIVYVYIYILCKCISPQSTLVIEPSPKPRRPSLAPPGRLVATKFGTWTMNSVTKLQPTGSRLGTGLASSSCKPMALGPSTWVSRVSTASYLLDPVYPVLKHGVPSGWFSCYEKSPFQI